MSSARRRRRRAAVALAGLVCAAGLTACDGDGDGGGDAAAPSASAPAATSAPAASAAPTATQEAASDDAKPCDLLTTDLAYEVFQETPPAADMDSPTMCSYTVPDGADGLGDTVSLAVEKWQDGLTVQDELDNLGIQGPNGQDNPQSLADTTLGADAVDVWDEDSVAVVWKAGDVHKLVVTGAKRVPDTKALLIDVAEKIKAGKRS